MLNHSWSNQSLSPLTSIKLCKISSEASSSRQPLVVTHCLSVSSDLQWSVSVHNHEVKQSNCPALVPVPKKLTPQSLENLLNLVDRLNVCIGHPDEHFVRMVSSKNKVLKSQDGSVMAFVDGYAPVVVNGEVLTETIRTTRCELLLDGDCMKCTPCKTYRATLRTLYSRYSRRSSSSISDTSSHANIRYMNTPEKKEKILIKKRAQSAEKEVSNLQAKSRSLLKSKARLLMKLYMGISLVL